MDICVCLKEEEQYKLILKECFTGIIFKKNSTFIEHTIQVTLMNLSQFLSGRKQQTSTTSINLQSYSMKPVSKLGPPYSQKSL